MSQKEKLKLRLLSQPKDFTIDELDTLMGSLGLQKSNRGRSSGSAIEYYNPATGHIFKIHSPHPGKVLKPYVIKLAIQFLTNEEAFEGK